MSQACEFRRPKTESLGRTVDNCQFSSYKDLFYVIGGHTYCIMHAPKLTGDFSAIDKQKFELILSQYLEILRQDEAVDLTGVKFPNEFDIGIFTKKARNSNGTWSFAECEFIGSVAFNAVIFKAGVSFVDTVFRQEVQFSGGTFKSVCDFSLAKFCGDTLFNAMFSGSPTFTKSHFSGQATFYGRLAKGAQFDEAHFEQLATFGLDQWLEIASFQRSRFLKGCNFSARQIPAPNFKNAIFDGEANFAGTIFHSVDTNCIDFSNTTFDGPANFSKGDFRGPANFSHARFQRAVHFDTASFLSAEFHEAEFQDPPAFDAARFQSSLNFREARFNGGVSFETSWFQDSTNFEGAVFGGDVSFRGTGKDDAGGMFSTLTMNGVVFKERADFSNRNFSGPTSFKNARFDRAPKFFNSTLHQDTSFSGAKFCERSGEDARRAYRRLKQLMEDVRAKREEGMFHAYEQECLRSLPNTPRIDRLMSLLYRITSGYGESVGRPLIWFLLSIPGAWLIYVALAGILFRDEFCREIKTAGIITFAKIFEFSFEQVVRPFQIWSGEYLRGKAGLMLNMLQGLEGLYVKFFATIHSLISLALVALFLLSIRRRFKMD